MMGGSESRDYLAPAEAGANMLVTCERGDYAADIEIAHGIPRAPEFLRRFDKPELVDTPGTSTIEGLAELLGIDAAATSKAMPVVTDGRVVLSLVRGDDRLDEAKLAAVLGGMVRPATDDEIKSTFGADPGSIGPVGVSIEVVADESLRQGQFVAGANETGRHLRGVEAGRDYEAQFADIRETREGDTCPNCGGALRLQTAIEVGHIFKLGTFYSLPLDATFLDEDGKEKPLIMGSYGIGPGRTMAAIVEQRHDEHGIVWPQSVSPYDVHVVVLPGVEEQGRAPPRRSKPPERPSCWTTATSEPGEVRRRGPDRLPGPDHRREEDARGRDGRRARPADRRGATGSRRRSWKLGSNTTLARRRRFSTEPFGPTLERLMQEKGVTYRALADQTNLSAGYLNHLVHGNRPVPSDEIVRRLAKALGVEPEHFREYRLRLITQRLEQMPELIDRLYRRLER